MPEQPQPYVGPRPFKREDARFFFGRERESNELLSLVISHPEVLLYAQSGAGKTSLINAKLLPLLEDEGLEMLPLARVQGPPSALPQSQIANIYVFNTLVSWTKGAAAPEKLAKMTLREFLKQREQPMEKEGLPEPCVAVFDQFEELFTSYPEHWEQRRGFFEQVRDALDANTRLRTLFAMREDYVAAIDRHARIMPEEFRIRFHLENLREPQALDAVKGPLTRDQRRHFAPDVAEELVKELMKTQVETACGRTESITGEFVEPIMLQVVCERLWRDLKPEDTEITFAHLETANVEKALLSFYEGSIQDVAQQTHIPEAALRSWFEKRLVTPAGTRGLVFRGDTETVGLPNEAVDALDKLHLIRSEVRGGSRWYELTHDRFIDSIRKSRERLLRNTILTWNVLCHATALVGFFVPWAGHILGPLIVWLAKRGYSSEIDEHGKESLNFQISMLIYNVVAGVLCLVLIGFVLLLILQILNLVLVIVASIQAGQAKFYRYPLTIRLIK